MKSQLSPQKLSQHGVRYSNLAGRFKAKLQCHKRDATFGSEPNGCVEERLGEQNASVQKARFGRRIASQVVPSAINTFDLPRRREDPPIARNRGRSSADSDCARGVTPSVAPASPALRDTTCALFDL